MLKFNCIWANVLINREHFPFAEILRLYCGHSEQSVIGLSENLAIASTSDTAKRAVKRRGKQHGTISNN